MKRLVVLVILILLVSAVCGAEDFLLLANQPSYSGSQNFSDFGTWFLTGAFCTGAGLLLGLVASNDGNGGTLPSVIIGTGLGFGTGMVASLMSSSGLTVSDQVGFRVVPVVLGSALSIIVVPCALAVGMIYFFFYVLVGH
jgi:hypothetical protein